MPKKIKILLVILALLFSSSCSRHEINSLAMVTCALYETTEDGKIKLTIEIIDPDLATKSNDKDESNTHILTGVGESTSEALSEITKYFSRNLFTQFVAARIFHEDFAKADLERILDYTLRENKIRESAYIMVLKAQNSQHLFKTTTDLDKNIHGFINKNAERYNKEVGNSVFVKTAEFIRAFYQEGVEPVAGILEVMEKEETLNEYKEKQDQKDNENTNEYMQRNKTQKGDPNKEGNEQQNEEPQQNGDESGEQEYVLAYRGLAVFKGSKMVGELNSDETKAYNIITGKIKNSVITLPFEDGYIDIFVKRCKTKIKTSFKDDKVTVTINPDLNILVSNNSTQSDVFDAEVAKKLKESFNQHIKEEIINTVKKVQGFESDIFAFGEYFRHQNNKEWKNIKDNWSQYFKNAQIEANVNTTLINIGTIKSPIENKGI